MMMLIFYLSFYPFPSPLSGERHEGGKGGWWHWWGEGEEGGGGGGRLAANTQTTAKLVFSFMLRSLEKGQV